MSVNMVHNVPATETRIRLIGDGEKGGGGMGYGDGGKAGRLYTYVTLSPLE